MDHFSDWHLGVGFPSKLTFREVLLMHVSSVIEVNVGIICACSLALPTFIERHGLHGLGSFMSRLISCPSLGQRGKITGAHSTERYLQPISRSQENRSDDIKLNTHGYSEFNKDDNRKKMQYIMTSKISDHQYPTTFLADVSSENVEALPEDSN
jgi:hypothetical protein